MEVSTEPMIYQLFVKLLDGKTLTLNSAIPRIYGAELKRRISEATGIPADLQRLATGTRHIGDESVVSGEGEHRQFPAVFLALRLRGGKGGFGSLLRGAGSKAWQKKTSNFDACRDMSGRRLRHVNAERRLEEWRAAEEERRLERKAEDFLKKVAKKKGKKGSGDGEAEKYVAKYREESERCASEVLDSVKASIKGVKRKVPENGSSAKRLKIWMGKRKFDGSDSDDSDEEHETSTISEDDNDNRSDSSKDAEGSSGSVTGRELSRGGSSEGGSEEEKENLVLEEGIDSEGLPNEDSLHKEHCEVPEPASHDETVSQAFETEAVQHEETNRDEHVIENVLTPSCGDGNEKTLQSSESRLLESDLIAHVEAGSSGKVAETEIPLNFDHFNSASELEVLGMERLKCELQDRGLKCGGTLQERATRLFLLKSTPLDRLPKKLLAKK